MVEKILPKLYKIEIPLPRNPLKILNSYLTKDRDRNLIIDTGLNQEECANAMRLGLKELEVDLRETDFFITHLHPDHLDLVSTLASDNSKIYFNRPDAETINSSGNWDDKIRNFARMTGFPGNMLPEIIEKYSERKYHEWNPEFIILKEGDTIGVGNFLFNCIETPGHTKGHMCLYESDEKILIAGDHILDHISPNISLWSYEDDPLNEYLKSLDKIYDFDIQLVLPGHRGLFGDCKRRILELKNHHQMRSNEVLSILEGRISDAFQIASQMSWDITYASWDLFPSPQKLFATTEAIAHLKFLDGKGFVKSQMRGKKLVFSSI